ncbi:unnamed protein product [Lampetra planeri]
MDLKQPRVEPGRDADRRFTETAVERLRSTGGIEKSESDRPGRPGVGGDDCGSQAGEQEEEEEEAQAPRCLRRNEVASTSRA